MLQKKRSNNFYIVAVVVVAVVNLMSLAFRFNFDYLISAQFRLSQNRFPIDQIPNFQVAIKMLQKERKMREEKKKSNKLKQIIELWLIKHWPRKWIINRNNSNIN